MAFACVWAWPCTFQDLSRLFYPAQPAAEIFRPFLSTYRATWAVTGLQRGGSMCHWDKELMTYLYLFPPTCITLYKYFYASVCKASAFFSVFFWSIDIAQYVMNYSRHILCDLSGIYNCLLCTAPLHFSGSIKGAANLEKWETVWFKGMTWEAPSEIWKGHVVFSLLPPD